MRTIADAMSNSDLTVREYVTLQVYCALLRFNTERSEATSDDLIVRSIILADHFIGKVVRR